MLLELERRRKDRITIIALEHDNVALFKKYREHFMGGTGRSSRGKAKQKHKTNEPQPKKRRVQGNECGNDDNASNENNLSDADVSGGAEAEIEQQEGDIRGELSDCRKGLEQLLVKLSELEGKVRNHRQASD